MEIFEVGGAVRDALLGRPVKERDWVVVGATSDELEKLGYRRVGKDFPVFLHPQTGEEYALARTETKVAPGYHGFDVDATPAVSLEEDLGRRDLTINAMARDSSGRIIDPYGGQRDLAAKRLRHVSNAFCEDPLRVLRVARFLARFHELGFTVADETISLMRTVVDAGELGALRPERVWRETEQALREPSPQQYFETLRACGALAVVFPEIEALFGVPQSPRWHPEIDTGVHTLMALRVAASLSPDPAVRFAVLIHDLGKAATSAALLPAHRGHEQRSVEIIENLCKRLPVPRRYRELALCVARYHGIIHRAAELRASTLFKVIEATDAIRRPERLEAVLTACEADARGRKGLEARPYPQRERLLAALAAAAATSSQDLDPALTGAALGEALRQRRIAAIRAALAPAGE
jgi:tRNA nucleotidyltransferase (CCA-adding enzyme)